MSKHQKKISDFKKSDILIVILALAIVGVVGFIAIVRHDRNNASSDSTLLSPCSTYQLESDATTNAFIKAYNNSLSSSLKVELDCGYLENGGYSEIDNLTTDKGVIYDSASREYSASPAGPIINSKCNLSVTAVRTAVADCGSGNFDLF